MMRTSRLVLGAVVVGLAVTFGCLVPPRYHASMTGQGGATTGTGGSGGTLACSASSTCEDVDKNPCTQETCMNEVCLVTPLTKDPGPGSTDCMTVACTDGALTTTIHDGKACGQDGKLKCAGAICKDCNVALDCGKTDECQISTCLPDTSCKFDFIPIGTPVMNAKLPNDMPGDCMATVCNGTGTMLLLADDKDVPVDAIECTDGHCMNGTPGQFSPSVVGAPCANGTTFCSKAQSCVVCATDANCPMGSTCYQDSACVSCKDTTKNGDETDVDCGGACGNTCKDGKDCKDNGDCASNSCSSGKCISCFDGMKNGDEVEKDCGGSCAQKCLDGTPCTNVGDCDSGNCVDKFCCATACADVCDACNVPTKEGACTQLGKGYDDPSPACSGFKTCSNGFCVNDGGKKHFGQPCMTNIECFSGNCSGQTFTCN